RPRSFLGPGLGVTVLGVCGLVVVRLAAVTPLQGGAAAPGFTGVPLLVIGAGLLWIVLTSAPDRLPKLAGLGWLMLVLVIGASGFISGRTGPLHTGGGDRLAAAQTAELARTGRSVVVL